MRVLLFYFRILLNYVRYKFVLRQSKKFLIDFGASIIGAKMISFGQSFAAKKGLRMEAFGENHELKIQIGDFVSFGEHVHLGAVNKITIEDNVLLGSRIIIIDHNHGKYNGENQSSPNEIPAKRVLFSAGPIIIRKNVWICDGAVILNNVTIGEGSIVAANTIVSKNVEAYTIVGGNPMKILKRYNFQSQKWE